MVQKPIQSDRSWVQRLGAERYLLISLVSFAGSVIATRMFLELTGYPQLGNSELHIAHVLWGGLLLFVSGLLPLALANAWAYTLGAALNGIGMGLFIDEIGKFITQSNDYFYPPAAAIIYAFFLLTVLLYTYIRRTDQLSPRGMMYQVLHDLGEVIDHDLQPEEKAYLNSRLNAVIRQAPGTNLALLAGALLEFLDAETLHLTENLPRWQHWWMDKQLQIRRWMATSQSGRQRFRLTLSVLLALAGGIVVARLALTTYQLLFNGGLAAWIVASLRAGELHSANEMRWSLIRIVLEGGFGLLLIVASWLLIARRELLGVRLAALSLVMSLTTVNLLVFYLDQFSAAATALLQFGLFLLVMLYRGWYFRDASVGHNGIL